MQPTVFLLSCFLAILHISCADTESIDARNKHNKRAISKTLYNITEIFSPEKLKPILSDEYVKAVYGYQEKYGLPEGWSEWMIKNYKRAYNAFKIRQQLNKKMTLAVYYYSNSFTYKTPWQNENEHMKDLENLLELIYPTWDFTLTFGGGSLLDGTVYLGSPGWSSADTANKKVYLHYETIIGHEVGHLLGAMHHYDGNADLAGQKLNMPPGESLCLMDRTSIEYGNLERFALDLPLEVDNSQVLDELITNILARYPDNY